MIKKFLGILLVLSLILFLSNIAYATDVATDLDNTSSADVSNEVIDNSVPSDAQEENSDTSNVDESVPDYDYAEQITSTTDYEDPSELSITNMINIILIAIGVVLVLLGIAIIIRLK